MPISLQSVTVTQVTLRPDDGYIVNFVDAKNTTDIFAQSAGFTVKPQGCESRVLSSTRSCANSRTALPYGASIIVSSSFTVSGSLTLAFPITETSYSGQTMPTAPITTQTAASSASSEAPAGPATATIVTKHSNTAFRGISSSSTVAVAMFAVVGGLIGAIAVL